MKTTFLFFAVLISFLCVSCSKASYPETMRVASDKALEGKWLEAEKLSAKAVSMKPESGEALLLHGLALEKCERQADGCEEIRKALSRMPDDYHANYHLGRILCEQQRFDSAIAPLNKALQIRRNDPNALILFAEACFRQKKYREAMSYYGTLVRMKDFQKNPQMWTSIGMIHLAQNNAPEAGKCFAYVCYLDRKNPAFALNYAIFLDRANRRTEAVKQYKTAAALMTGNPDSAEKLSWVQGRIRTLTR